MLILFLQLTPCPKAYCNSFWIFIEVSIFLLMPFEACFLKTNEFEVSASATSAWHFLRDLGLATDTPVGGRPNARGQTGAVIRWGEGWFEPVRDGGLGWDFPRDASPEIDKRVQILMSLSQNSDWH